MIRLQFAHWIISGFSLFLFTPSHAGDAGLLGYWKFDEGQGDVATDSSDRGNDGEIWDAEWVRGAFGAALHFDGQGAHVAIPEIAGLDGSDELTLSAWVCWEGAGRYPNILSGGRWSPGGFMLFVQDQRCAFRMGRPEFSATRNPEQWGEVSASLLDPFELGRWYHLAATFKRPEIRTYVDGKEAGSARWDYPVGYHDDLIIGKWSGKRGHEGLIDEVKIFNRALSAEEVAADFQRGLPGRTLKPGEKITHEPIPRASQLERAVAVFENDFASLAIGPGGRGTALIDRGTGEDRILRTTPLVSIKQDGRVWSRAVCSKEGKKLAIRFSGIGTTVVVDVTVKPEYFVFRVDSVDSPGVEELEFLRLNLKPCEFFDATSGLAADDTFGVCMRALNLATNVTVSGNPPALRATAFREHGVKNGAAAIVACPRPRLLPVLQNLVRAEGLPYSPLGGPFALDAEGNRGSYLFAGVSEENVGRWIDLAQRSGIPTVHLSGWQKSLGHYEPQPDLFPHGLDGLKSVADKLHAAGLKVGIHTLTGCIDTHDPWVRPVPDPRLATDGTFTLAADLTEAGRDVPTAAPPGNYPTIWGYASHGNCIRIDDELLRYSAISNDSNPGFFQCERGAFGTKAAPHAKGAPVHHLIARYGGFVPDEHSTLVDEIADAIAHVYNTCGLDQIYMDGAEAMRGWYGIGRMREAIFTRLKGTALVEASCWNHHSWPFHSRIGAWDHPKWGLKRFADDHLAAVEDYRRGALLEAQLGWWAVVSPGRDWDMEMPDEIEYLCAKALGHDTPLSFQSITMSDDPPNARQDEYLTTVGRYERLRLANYFSEEVKAKLREPRQEFRLVRAEDGEWEFLPTDYLQHKVTGPDDRAWTVTNRFPAQPVKLRLQALYSARPNDDPQGVELADFSRQAEFAASETASGVKIEMGGADGVPEWPAGLTKPGTIGKLAASNTGDTPVGAWGRVVKTFDPVVDITPHDALGLWVHGDGKGALLNLQLTNPPEYGRVLDDHYIKLDFQGWRYCELLLRERDAAAWHDYRWPYGAHCVLHRSPLERKAVNQLTAYLNNVPAGGEVACYLSPVRALRTQKVVLHHPSIEIGGRRMVFPVDLETGMYIELESPDDCRLYDERGRVLRWLTPEGDVPVLAAGANEIAFTCGGTEGFSSRAEITLIAGGPPIGGRNPREQIDGSLLDRSYEFPRAISELDGRQNAWQIFFPPGVKNPNLRIDLRAEKAGSDAVAYESPGALAIADFDEPKENGSFAYDAEAVTSGCLEGVNQALARSVDLVKVGKSSARYTATSAREDNGGWSVKNGPLSSPLDLSGFGGIGFWLHGDGGGQQFKLQLRDAGGGWQDMYTGVDFEGWRFCRFDLGGPQLKEPKRIVAVNLYYNGIPAGRTVTCYVDGIRALPNPAPLRDPAFRIGGQEISLPVVLNAGDRLVWDDSGGRLILESGEEKPFTALGNKLILKPGLNPVDFRFSGPAPAEFRVVARLSVAGDQP